MEEQVFHQKSSAEQSPKEKKKQKYKELSTFWKGMVIGLSLSTIAAVAAAIGYFMENIYPLLGLMGV